VSSLSVDEAVDGLLASDRGLVVAAAGCGKTELIARTAASSRAGRQLVLTHTHAGVAALKSRLDKLKVGPDRYHLDTIAGWALKYAAAYPDISGLDLEELTESNPEWNRVYPATRLVVAGGLGTRVVSASYDGVLVDEYQDCSTFQHAIVASLAAAVPVRVVGDPLQAIFGFRSDDPMVDWSDVEAFFERLPDLQVPHRWQNANTRLGAWLIDARAELLATNRVTIGKTAPVAWAAWSNDGEIEACRAWKGERGVVAIKRSTMWNKYVQSCCLSLATRLGGRFHMVEAFDDRDLPQLAAKWSTTSGGDVVRSLHAFARARMVKVGPELKSLVAAVADGRSTVRFEKYLDHRDRLELLAANPTPEAALAVLDGFRKERGWTVYRPEGIYQLRSALQESAGLGMDHLLEAVATVRTRARHRGRHVPWRALGTTLLLKGLEFDDAMVLNADELSRNEVYVAITRGARSLRILSADRTIPAR